MTCICEWCLEEFDAPHRHGPKPKFCRPSHRQRAYEARRLSRLIREAGGTS